MLDLATAHINCGIPVAVAIACCLFHLSLSTSSHVEPVVAPTSLDLYVQFNTALIVIFRAFVGPLIPLTQPRAACPALMAASAVIPSVNTVPPL